MKLNVFWKTRLAGHIWLDSRQHIVFQYTPGYLSYKGALSLSLRLPLQDAPYEDDAARPFFANLLPEGEIRDLISKIVHVSKQNDFALLREIGGECAGAISILPEGHTPVESGAYQQISRGDIEDMIKKRARTPLLAGRKDLRLSLAGAQDKLPIYLSKGKVYLPTENEPSSHILKPQIRGLADTVHNEAFCMMLAKRIFSPALRIPDVSIWHGEQGAEFDALVIERYDRKKLKGGRVLRIQQEDFCQALGYLANQKYENEGGPGLKECFSLLAGFSIQPIVDRLHLLRWVVYNYLIGNNDAHAKNLAIFFPDGKPALAPFYDMLCTQAYEDLSEKMAMKIGGENRHKFVYLRHWERLALGIAIKPKIVIELLKEYSVRVIKEAEDLALIFLTSYGGKAIVDDVLEVIRMNSAKIENLLS